ncbi:hypothetical protein BaRGS_00019752 [Batillaria attramentaria]|uniref:PXA domain-containing protein n=1 Tax=Batillaria attramentaria TaxID=370345 RepID=A0ABD0KNW7_9CAEN
MSVVDEIYAQGRKFAKDFLELLKWDRYTSLHKLAILTAVASIAAVFLDHWGLLIALITSVAALLKLTGDALSGRWRFSSDPLAPFIERLDGVRESLTAGIGRSMGTERNPAQEFRARSESIASPHIPDLEVGLDPSASGSSFNKNIRLELNSIVLLIVRDFVQFWYHTFSYSSQFLKDARHFLFKAIHNLVERISRLRPHQTSAKLIHAYQVHLSSFQTARSLFEAQHPPVLKFIEGRPSEVNRTFRRLESIDEAFHSKFHYHRALDSADAEKEYLRSVTKTILLCACTKDVISASSAQIFFVEVLSVNVLLPLAEMLSTPDRLYEILIRLTYYNEDVMLNDDVLKQLIEAEVENVRSKSAVRNASPSSIAVTDKKVDEECERTETDSASPSQTCTSGQSSNVESTVRVVEAQQSHREALKQISENRRRGSAGAELPKSTRKMSKEDATGIPEKHRSDSTRSDSSKSTRTRSKESLSDVEVNGKHEKTHSENEQAVKELKDGLELDLAKSSDSESIETQTPAEPDAQTPDSSAACETAGPEQQIDAQDKGKQLSDGVSDSAGAEAISEVKENVQENHVYAEMTSTGLPAVKPKFQAFKDLFKSKKSKQLEEAKADGGLLEKETEPDKNGVTDALSKPVTEVSTAQRIKSLRLSPLLSRSNRFFASGNQDKLSTEDAGKDGQGFKRSPTSGQESAKQTPSPLPTPTPSPSQTTKGGPLSFLRFRKPTFDFRKSSTSTAVTGTADGKCSESVATDQDLAPPVSGAGATAVTPSDSVPSGAGAVPTVQVTDEDANTKPANTSTMKQIASAPTLRTISISSYDEISVSDYEDNAGSTKRSFFIPLGEEDEDFEQAEEAETLAVGTEGALLSPPDSSFIFQDISIPSTSTGQEFRSNASYTLYHIEYEALHFSESGNPVLRTGTVKRRHREFTNLMSRLEDNAAYKRLLKDVKGPKRWQTLPFKNMDKESVASRQKALEQFLKSLIQVEAVCNGPELREFLAYEGDSHIAFVRKAPEINMPRIDKMFARTVSGVFDRLKSLPSLPQEVISGIRGRDSSVERREGSQDCDTDSIVVATDFSQEMEINALRDISEKFVRDQQIQGHTRPETDGSSLKGDASVAHQILLQVPRVEGDGAESPGDPKEGLVGQGGMGDAGRGQLLLCDTVIDLVVQLLQGQGHWFCRQRVITVLHNTLGITMDRWLQDKISSLTTEERCLYYIRLLRETVWPGGTLFSGERAEKSVEERAATRAVAKRLLLEFFPDLVHLVMGEDSMDAAAEQILESLQYTKLNKHFIYTTLDLLMENLFPEMADPEFQSRLLS